MVFWEVYPYKLIEIVEKSKNGLLKVSTKSNFLLENKNTLSIASSLLVEKLYILYIITEGT